MEINKIVFTGGPCAGKTTIINEVTKILKNDGYFVINVSETATELISGSILPNDQREHTLKFQDYVYRLQSAKEKIAEEYAKHLSNSNLELIKDKKGIIIIYDRAIMDNRAYLPHEDYNNLLKKHNCNEISIIDKYDLVIDLVSLATSKPELYSLDGVRYESPEEAAKKDELTSGAWLLHRNLHLIMPTEELEEKIQIVLKKIYNLLNKKEEEQFSTFYLDKKDIDFSIYDEDNSRKIYIKQYRCNEGKNKILILSKRQYNGDISYVKDSYSIYEGTFKSEQITESKYLETISLCPTYSIGEKEVLSVIFNGNHYNLVENNIGAFMLEADVNRLEETPNDIQAYLLKKYNHRFRNRFKK